MTGTEVGHLYYDLDIDDSKLRNQLDKADKSVKSFGDRVGSHWTDTVAIGQKAMVGIGLGATALVGGLTAASKAAFDQVRSVENATFGLKAYEKDANKVNEILKQLVAYARSDMGVLFQRDELFKAASNLRGFGDEADKVVDHVKILSKGVSLGMTSFDELSQIIGRTLQKGRLDAESFDMLAQRGIILDSSFRSASVSSEKLFSELNRVLPDSLLEGRANTIDGSMIRLKSAFRDVGSAILGVDKNTSKFVEGGLGSKILEGINRFRDALKDPAVINAAVKIGSTVGQAILLIVDSLMFLAKMWNEHKGIVITVAGGIMGLLVPALIATTINLFLVAAGVIAATWPFILIGAVAAAAAYLIVTHWDTVLAFLRGVWEWITRNWPYLLGVIVGPFGLAVVYVIRHFTEIKNWIMNFFSDAWHWLYDAGTQMIQGLINGIRSKISDLNNTVKGAVSGSVSQIKNALGIHSPSKVFMEIGKNVSQGFIEGINSSSGAVADAMGSMGMSPTQGLNANSANTNSNVTINIGTINDRADADYLINRLNRSQELASMGVST